MQRQGYRLKKPAVVFVIRPYIYIQIVHKVRNYFVEKHLLKKNNVLNKIVHDFMDTLYIFV